MDLDKIVADIKQAVEETRETKVYTNTNVAGVSKTRLLSEEDDQLLQLALKIKDKLGDAVASAFSVRLEYATWRQSTKYCHPGEVGERKYY